LRRELDAPIVELPFYFDPVIDRAVLDRMAAELIEGVA
jgi:hypothetical protein